MSSHGSVTISCFGVNPALLVVEKPAFLVSVSDHPGSARLRDWFHYLLPSFWITFQRYLLDIWIVAKLITLQLKIVPGPESGEFPSQRWLAFASIAFMLTLLWDTLSLGIHVFALTLFVISVARKVCIKEVWEWTHLLDIGENPRKLMNSKLLSKRELFKNLVSLTY